MDLVNVELSQDFLDFYNRFHRDTAFQIEHVVFPLSGKSKNLGRDSSSVWTADNWSFHTEGFLDQEQYDWDFEIIADGFIRETLRHKAFPYALERRWSRSKDAWYLIYYQDYSSMKAEE